jgi:isopenicillin-N epimerase
MKLGSAVRAEWALDPDFLTVNHGSYGATPRVVMAAQDEWRRKMEAQPTRFFARILPDALREMASVLAKALSVKADEVVFVPNATTGCNAVLRSMDLREGDEILHASHVYNAVRNTMIYVAGRSGAKVVSAELPFPRPDKKVLLANIEKAITKRTRIAVIDHITSPSGLVLPIAEIIALCHAAGVPVLVDGAHGPGQVPLDLEVLGADWYVGNCHKWWSAPKGCGFLHARGERRTELHPVTISHGYGTGFAKEFDWTGTVDPSAYLALPAALDFFERLGGAALMERNKRLAAEAGAMLAATLGTEVGATPDFAGAMASVRLPFRMEPTREGAIPFRMALQAAGCDAPVHGLAGGPWLRLSAYAYNELSDYQRLAQILPGVIASMPH